MKPSPIHIPTYCGSCKTVKDIEDFGVDRTSKRLRQSWCLACGAAYRKAWYLRNKDKIRARNIAYRAANPLRLRAHRAVEVAVRNGVLKQPRQCPSCGLIRNKRNRLQAHHDDYAKPLDVTWLCRSCHQLEHAPAELHEIDHIEPRMYYA